MNQDATLVNAYADALFNAALKSEDTEKIVNQCVKLKEFIAGDRKFRAFLEAPNISREDKENVFVKVSGEVLNQLVVNFVRLLVKKDRMLVLLPALDRLHTLFLAHKGLLEGTLVSAVELGESEKKDLLDALTKFTKKDLSINWKTDESLIGGIRFQAGDLLVDSSLSHSLERLKQDLSHAKVV